MKKQPISKKYTPPYMQKSKAFANSYKPGYHKNIQTLEDNRPQNTIQKKIQPQSNSYKTIPDIQPGAMQFASDPEGVLVNHPSGGISFTFHHIVPENRLKVAWNKIKNQKLQNPLDTSKMMTGFKAVLSKGYTTLMASAKTNIINDLKKECYKDQFKGDEYPTPVKIGEELDKLDDTYASNDMALELLKPGADGELIAKVRTIISKSTKAITNEDSDYVKESESSKADTEAKHNPVLKHMIMWIPGNIHRGPSNRIAPGGDGWDENKDDGGDSFEKSAEKVVSAPHWTALKNLNAAVEGIIDGSKVIGDLNTALETISQYDMTEYDASKWEQDAAKGNKWRLK